MIQQALERIRSEFLEMPGMRLTAPQVQRLCGIDPPLCEAALKALVDSKFLTRHSDGIYARMTLDTVRHAQPLKATLRSSALADLEHESQAVAARHRR